MKNFKGILLLVALCAMNNASAATMLQGANYQRFSNWSDQYKDRIIASDNTVDMNWVQQAVAALRQDGIYNENDFANILWREIEPMVNYQAQLPQNRANASFKQRIWESLNRSLDEIRRSPQQAQQWQPAAPRVQVQQGPVTIAQQRAPQAPYVPGVYVPQSKPLSNLDKMMLEKNKPLSNLDKMMLERKQAEAAKVSQQASQKETIKRSTADKMQYVNNLGQLKKYKDAKAAGPSTAIFRVGEMEQSWLNDVFAILSKNILLTQEVVSDIERVMQDYAADVVLKVLKTQPKYFNAQQIAAAQNKVRAQVSRFIKQQI